MLDLYQCGALYHGPLRLSGVHGFFLTAKISGYFRDMGKEAQHWWIVGITCQLKAPKYVMPGRVCGKSLSTLPHIDNSGIGGNSPATLKGHIFHTLLTDGVALVPRPLSLYTASLNA